RPRNDAGGIHRIRKERYGEVGEGAEGRGDQAAIGATKHRSPSSRRSATWTTGTRRFSENRQRRRRSIRTGPERPSSWLFDLFRSTAKPAILPCGSGMSINYQACGWLGLTAQR